MKRIAIVGGGFSGAAVGCELVKCLRASSECKASPVHIDLFDPKGVASNPVYCPSLPDSYRLNHEFDDMGRLGFREDHSQGHRRDFFEWVQANLDTAMPDGAPTLRALYGDSGHFDISDRTSYVPRSLYGRYISAHLEQLCAVDEKSCRVRLRKERVADVTPRNGMYHIASSDASSNEEAPYDAVVLATGNPYAKHCTFYPDALRSFRPQEFSSILADSSSPSVGIIGSSLSAIEAAIELARRGVDDVTLYSPEARLPKVRGRFDPEYTLREIPDAMRSWANTTANGSIALDDVVAKIKEEFDAGYRCCGVDGKVDHYHQGAGLGLDWDRIVDNVDPIAQLEQDIAASRAANNEAASDSRCLLWRSIICAFLHYEVPLWNALSVEDKRVALRKHSPFLLSHLAPMPLPQAAELHANFVSGKTKLRAATIRTARTSADGRVQVEFTNGEAAAHTHIVDGSGTASGARSFAPDSVEATCIRNEVLCPHPVQGIRVDQRTFRCVDPAAFSASLSGDEAKMAEVPHTTAGVNADPDVFHQGLYAFGWLTSGEFVLQTATPFVERFASATAKSLLENLFK